MTTPVLQAEATEDRFNAGLSQTVSAVDVIQVTPSDTADLEKMARALRARTGGDLRITTYLGEVRDTFIGDGELLPICVRRVHSAGTTATGIEALL